MWFVVPKARRARPSSTRRKWLAAGVPVGLYIDLIGAALAGVGACFWLPELGKLNEVVSRQVLIVLLGLQVFGALWRRFVARDGS